MPYDASDEGYERSCRHEDHEPQQLELGRVENSEYTQALYRRLDAAVARARVAFANDVALMPRYRLQLWHDTDRRYMVAEWQYRSRDRGWVTLDDALVSTIYIRVDEARSLAVAQLRENRRYLRVMSRAS